MTRTQLYFAQLFAAFGAWSLAALALIVMIQDPAGVWRPKPVAEVAPVVLKPIAKLSKSQKAVNLAALTPDCNVHDWGCVIGESVK